MDVAENLDWRWDFKQRWFLFENVSCSVEKKDNIIFRQELLRNYSCIILSHLSMYSPQTTNNLVQLSDVFWAHIERLSCRFYNLTCVHFFTNSSGRAIGQSACATLELCRWKTAFFYFIFRAFGSITGRRMAFGDFFVAAWWAWHIFQ